MASGQVTPIKVYIHKHSVLRAGQSWVAPGAEIQQGSRETRAALLSSGGQDECITMVNRSENGYRLSERLAGNTVFKPYRTQVGLPPDDG